MPSRKQADKRDALDAYRGKRRASGTPEPMGRGAAAPAPRGGAAPLGEGGLFVVQQHHARHLHFDFRLEMDGALRSWAVPKGPSAVPSVKRFAALVEDHPLEYADFEGAIPEGNYGAGYVIVWDRGIYRALEDMDLGFRRGKLLFELSGYKLRGRFTLVRMKKANEWLLIKERDAFARDADAFAQDSVLSGLTVEDAGDGSAKRRTLAARLRKRKLPAFTERWVPPMLASSGEPFDREGWVFELKYDGYRLQVERRDESVVLRSRNGLDLTAQLPEIVQAARLLPAESFTLDGEIVVHDAAGRPDFEALAARIRLADRNAVIEGRRHRPTTLYTFDCIELLGLDLRGEPLTFRKALLEALLPTSGVLRYSAHIERAGRSAFDAARKLGLEGVIGKRAEGRYVSGRSNDWIKVRADKTDDFVVVGWIPMRGTKTDVGALALGQYEGERLVYRGRVGTGFDATMRAELARRFAKLEAASPLAEDRSVNWVEPSFVAEVSYREITNAGHLRHPVFGRLRDDKRPEQCRSHVLALEPPAPVATEHEVVITHPEKIFFPEKGLTKLDLVDYYEGIAPWMQKYLTDRPIVLTRFPDGIHGKSFYQRDAPAFVPEWIRREVLWSEGSERKIHYFVLDDVASLKYIANMGAIPIHTWHARVAHLEQPDWCVLDLDPKSAPFSAVIETAHTIYELTKEIDLPAYLKTSGSSGLHVLIPLARRLTHDQSRTFAELLARVVIARIPDVATINRSVPSRKKRVYIDYLQNGHGKLLVTTFSARAVPSASVSMPLKWSELTSRLDNANFHIQNARKRMQRLGEDPLADVLTTSPDLLAALERLTDLARRAHVVE